MLRRHLLLAPLALTACRPRPASLQIAAASDLASLVDPLLAAFRRDSGLDARPIVGSTGLLSRQIAEGAPFDALLAAHVRYVDDLIHKGHLLASGRAIYARGRVALWSRSPTELAGLASARKVALANPDHAPYGAAARQALERAGLWGELSGRCVLADNVQHALRLAELGEADAALTSWSLVHQRPEARKVDQALHDPIDQGAAPSSRSTSPEGAARLCRFLTGDEAGQLLRAAGFETPPR